MNERPSEFEQWMAQYELFRAAFRAPDLPQISKAGSRERKAQLAGLGKGLAEVAHNLQEIISNDLQVAVQAADIWFLYKRTHRDDPLVKNLPDNFNSVANVLKRLSHFFDRASANIKPAGPAPYLGTTRGKNTQRTTVIRYIAEVCKHHYGAYMHGTVARLVNIVLDRTDIDEVTVRGSLRDPGVKSSRGHKPHHSG
jgi:hypothetical protein